MVKIAPRQVTGFLAKPTAEIRLVLIYGPDAGLVRERLSLLAKTIVDDLTDPFRVALLDETSLKNEPGILADEAAQIAMMGGRRVVMVRNASSQACSQAVKYFLERLSGDALVLLGAGDLGARDELRMICEQHQAAATIACYQDDAASLGQLLQEIMRRDNIRIDDQASLYIIQHLGADHGQSRMEIEKLALYAGQGQELTIDMVVEALGNSAEARVDDFANFLLLGKWADADRLLEELWQQSGTEPIGLLRQIIAKCQRLQRLLAKIAEGSTPKQALDSHSPKLFFREVPLIETQLKLWTEAKLNHVLNWLGEAEAECKRSHRPIKAIAGRCFMQIAWAAKQNR